METRLAVSNELFGDMPVRFVRFNGKTYVPIVDIAKAIKYERRDLARVIETHEDMFVDGKMEISLETIGGAQNTICVNRDGVISLFMGLKIKMIKDETRKSTIIRFRKWAIETLSKVQDGKSDEVKPFAVQQVNVQEQTQKQPPSVSIGNLVSDRLQIADAMAKYAHVDRGIATSMALSQVEFETGVDLKMWKNMLPKEKANKPVCVLTPTEIGKELGLGYNSGYSVNNILWKHGFLSKAGDKWVLTQKGEMYGEAFPVTGIAESGKSYARYQLKWHPKIVTILHDLMHGDFPSTCNGLISGYY
jgi:hypothetical protein